ncbi:hypothetical protein [Microbacterium sp. NPDC076911]|uniref:hypothetical protein n=1 Tax=Microbacterium sp. NPDC076911 TaxID=3154958 RepID=UPI003419DA7B
MTPSDAIQLSAVLAAVAAAIVALVISALDRRNARDIADADRASALRHAHLMFELQTLTRLSENFNRGGSADSQESKRMGAEALTLIGALSPERLPNLWAERVGDDAKLRAHFDDPDFPEYKKWALEAQLGLSEVLRDIRAEQRRR